MSARRPSDSKVQYQIALGSIIWARVALQCPAAQRCAARGGAAQRGGIGRRWAPTREGVGWRRAGAPSFTVKGARGGGILGRSVVFGKESVGPRGAGLNPSPTRLIRALGSRGGGHTSAEISAITPLDDSPLRLRSGRMMGGVEPSSKRWAQSADMEGQWLHLGHHPWEQRFSGRDLQRCRCRPHLYGVGGGGGRRWRRV